MSNNSFRFDPNSSGEVSARVTQFAAIRSIHGLQKARRVLGLSQSQLAREITRLARQSGEHPVSRSTVANWESRRKMMARQYVDAVGRLLATWVSDKLGRRIATRIQVNSPWQVTLFATCSNCNKWFEIRRSTQRK